VRFFFLAGVSALFVYLFPELEGQVLLLGTIIGIWQGILFLKQDSRQDAQVG
jgi:hypothetical protein